MLSLFLEVLLLVLQPFEAKPGLLLRDFTHISPTTTATNVESASAKPAATDWQDFEDKWDEIEPPKKQPMKLGKKLGSKAPAATHAAAHLPPAATTARKETEDTDAWDDLNTTNSAPKAVSPPVALKGSNAAAPAKQVISQAAKESNDDGEDGWGDDWGDINETAKAKSASKSLAPKSSTSAASTAKSQPPVSAPPAAPKEAASTDGWGDWDTPHSAPEVVAPKASTAASAKPVSASSAASQAASASNDDGDGWGDDWEGTESKDTAAKRGWFRLMPQTSSPVISREEAAARCGPPAEGGA
jgi:hypothetical protein